LPRTLKDVGVGRDKFDALTENCLKDRWLATNPVPVTTKEQVREILEMCAGDRKLGWEMGWERG
jgi:alcohol dehydrogenase class IV